MKQLKCYTIIGILFVLGLGTLSHFLYAWTGNNFIIGLITPVNESTWEHMKLLYFPMLLYSPVMAFRFRKKYPCTMASLCLGILCGTTLIPVFFYSYTYVLGKNIFLLDLMVFAASVIIAFIIVYHFALSDKLLPFFVIIYVAMCIYLICFVFFTCQPPDFALFKDPTVSSISFFWIIT